MNRQQIHTLVENSTAGLEGDTELRLDAQAELLSHLEATADIHRAEGKSDEESLDLAAKSFGSPLDVASDLADANRSRMKWRALARLTAQALLVPAAIATVWFSLPFFGLAAWQSISICEVTSRMESLFIKKMFRHLTDDQSLILFGDTSRATPAEQQRAIWEKDPTNRLYYGNYITHLISATSAATDAVSTVQLEAAFREGERLDPDNARYNYLLADSMLRRAADVRWNEPAPGSTNKESRLVIRDRQLLDAAMAEFLKGQNKPVLMTYGKEMMALRMALLPPSASLVERIQKIAMAAGILLPDLSKMRPLARAGIMYGEQLVAEGRKPEAMPFLHAWHPLSQKVFSNSFTLIETLVGFAIVSTGQEKAPTILEAAGEPEQAAATRLQTAALLAPKEQWDRRRKAIHDGAEAAIREGSVLMAMLLPAGEPLPSARELAFGRLTECVVAEQAGLACCLAGFVLLMFGMLVATLRWRWVRGFASAPLLLLPSWRQLGLLLVYAVVIPVGAYYLYTRHSGLSGCNMPLPMRFWVIALELGVLAAVILCIAVPMSVRRTWGRCRELGIAVPANVSAIKLIAIALVPFGLLVWLLRGRNEGLFRGSVARSLIPVFALVVILLGLTSAPYLRANESSLVRQDTLTSSVERGEGFTDMETRLVKRLQQEVLAVFDLQSRKP
jgi:hypothetical protein